MQGSQSCRGQERGGGGAQTEGTRVSSVRLDRVGPAPLLGQSARAPPGGGAGGQKRATRGVAEPTPHRAPSPHALPCLPPRASSGPPSPELICGLRQAWARAARGTRGHRGRGCPYLEERARRPRVWPGREAPDRTLLLFPGSPRVGGEGAAPPLRLVPAPGPRPASGRLGQREKTPLWVRSPRSTPPFP